MSEAMQDGMGGATESESLPARPFLLAQAREAAGLHIAALAAALKVPVKKLEALEAGRYRELPDLTFARALASSACRQLKIDPAPVLDQIPHSARPVLLEVPPGVNAPFKARTEPVNTPPGPSVHRPALWITALALLAAGLLAWAPDWREWPGRAALGDAWETVSAAVQRLKPAESAVDDAKPADPSAAVPEPGAPAAAAVTRDAMAVALEPSAQLSPGPAGDAPASVGAAGQPLLSLTAQSDSWIEVVDGAGKVQVQRMLKSGDMVDFSGNPPYSVVLGRADAVKVQVRGSAFDVRPFARNSVARFEVK